MAGFQPGAFQPGAFQQGGTQSNGGPSATDRETLWGGGLRASSYIGGRYRYDKRKRKKPSTADLKMLLKAGYAIGQLRKKKRDDD